MNSVSESDVLLVVATDTERDACLTLFSEHLRASHTLVPGRRRTYFDLGAVAGATVCMVQCEMGSGAPGAAQSTVADAVDELRPKSVIMVGVSFGVDQKKQQVGQVLVSKQLKPYEIQRVGTDTSGKPNIVSRGDKVTASTTLLSRFRSSSVDWKEGQVNFGLLLSGEKLLDNIDVRNDITQLESEAIGGEMEGAGLYTSCVDRNTNWIIIKAICDWADGNKSRNKKQRQALAANKAASFVIHTLKKGGFSQKSYQTTTHSSATVESQASPIKHSMSFAERTALMSRTRDDLIYPRLHQTGLAGITPENDPADDTGGVAPKKILRSSNPLAIRRRTQPEISFSFTPEMAESADQEHFFLSFGKVGAGKTTLHYHLLRYFEQRPDFDGREVVDDTLPDGQLAGQAQLINNWRSRWAEGVFPQGTLRTDEVRAIRYSIRPTTGNRKRINITFLEVAGELLTEIINNDPYQRSQFPPALEALFANNGVKLIIAFVISPIDLKNDTDDKNIEMIFPAFLNYLRGKFPERARTPLMVVLNNPDEALQIPRNPALGVDMKGETEWTPELLQLFLDEVMPTFMQNFRRWSADRKSKMVTLFSVGRVRRENIEGEERSIIETPANFRHAAAVARFIYETFTGTRIQASLLSRLLIWMKVKS